ncbi:MAG: hypothetical protein PHQ27_01060 [Victivallales bacterium]|nr:hypothetical protein [Victivallales bacterium]
MKPVKFFIGIWLLLSTAAALPGAESSDMGNAKLTDFKLPQYSEGGKLVFILYGESGYAAGINVFLEKVVIDLVQSSIKDIDSVHDLQGVELYPLGTSAAEIAAFWADKPYAAALIYSPTAVFDRSTNTIKGDRDVHFRSRLLDIDGEGFDGDYQSKTIHIRKNVQIEIRRLTSGLGSSRHIATAVNTEQPDRKGSEK